MNRQLDPEMRRVLRMETKSCDVEYYIKQVIEQTNMMGDDVQEAIVRGMVQGLLKSHRTLQQKFIAALHQTLVQYGESESDLRNEEAVAWAKKVSEIEAYFPAI